jgi:hypothetical protein
MAREHATAKAVEGWAERFGRLLPNSFFGILPHSTALRVRMTAKTCNSKLTATAKLLAGLRLQMRFSCLFELSRIRLERKKEWLCNSGKVLLRS